MYELFIETNETVLYTGVRRAGIIEARLKTKKQSPLGERLALKELIDIVLKYRY